MRRSTRVRKREHEDASDGRAAAEDPRTLLAKATAVKRAKRAVEDTRASPSPSSSPDDFDDAHGDEDHGHNAASRGSSGTPEWVFSIFSEQKRAQWDEFLRTKCLARVGADFYDLFELAIAISEDEPLEAFIDTLGIQLCGPFDLLALAVCEKKQDVSLDKPLFLHGRFFLDPPEVTTVLKDASNGIDGAHWGYFRDVPEQTPEYIVFAKDSSKCSFQIAGSSLFHVLDFSIQEQLIKSPNDQGLKDLATKVKQYLCFRKLSARVTPANLSRKRASQATAASLHKLGIVVPYNAKKQTGFRELPVVGDQLAVLLQDVQEGNAKARKALSGLITRATIANDECDFGTSLLLGLDLFTTGEALEKESLQLLRVAYMLLRRLNFYKIVSAQTTHRRATSVSSSSSDHNPSHMLTSIVTAPSGDDAQPSSNLGGSTQVSSSHVTDASQPKITTVSLP